MTYYAGLDVSLEETAICVVDADGTIVREVRAESAQPDVWKFVGGPIKHPGCSS